MSLIVDILAQFLVNDLSQIVLCYSLDYTWERKQVVNELDYLFRKAGIGRVSMKEFIELCIDCNKRHKEDVEQGTLSLYQYRESCAPGIFEKYIKFSEYTIQSLNDISRMSFTYECDNPLFNRSNKIQKRFSVCRSKFNWLTFVYPKYSHSFPIPIDPV